MNDRTEMLAATLTEIGAEVLPVTRLPMPKVGTREILIRNQAGGVNYIDVLIRRGGVLPPEATPLPHVLGVEGAGIVEAVGDDVSGFRPGDRVMWLGTLGSGGYGEYTAIDAAYAAGIDDSVSFEAAAAVPVTFVTAMHMLTSYGAPQPGAWVLIHSAAGGVGSAAIQVARNSGLRTIGLASASKLDFVLQNGADHAVDRSRADLVDHIRSIVGGEGVALSLNSAAGATIVDDLQLLGNFGQLISFGHLGGLPEGSAADLLMPYFNKSIGIRVSDLYTLWGADKARFSQMLGAVARDLAAGKIDPNLHAVVPARSAMDAHHYFDRQDLLGKIVLKSEW